MTTKEHSFADLRTELTGRTPFPPLRPPGPWRPELSDEIGDLAASPLARAGLFLWNDDIAHCHQLAQRYETPDGNYWHAILHRREGDYENAKYWYRRVGDHPVLARVRQRFPEWDPFRFVDECRTADSDPDAQAPLEEIQALEMSLLLAHIVTES